jgi:putative transposase
VVKPVKRREVVRYLMARYSVGLRRACRCARMSRASYSYTSQRDPQTALRQRVRELAQSRVRFGYRRIFMLLRREGWDVGKDRLYRVYREEGLGLRRKRPWRHVSAVHREVRTPAKHRNDVWSMDFVADELTDGRRFRTLTVVDVFTRECLEIEIGQSLKAEDVVRVLERSKYARGIPGRIYCDNGSEFVSGLTDQWAYTNGVKLEFSRLGKPTDNAVIESFNGRFRDECLNTHWFESLEDAKTKIDAWRWDYNEHRPHRSLEGLTPREFASRAMLKRAADSQS